ncbi:hypothetical protein ASF04_08450 [Duganella sp. Leaf61]|nr:hypothetical protein ASF04_08450 [Duganella sp. Leaf61]
MLARLNHDLRAPLAQIAARAHGDGLDDIAGLAHRQLAWLGDLHACARYEVAAPELAPAPTYLHALMQAHGVRYQPQSLPGLAMLDARLLAQVLERVAGHSGAPLVLDVAAAADGMLALAFHTGDGNGDAGDNDNDNDNNNDSGNWSCNNVGKGTEDRAGTGVAWTDVHATLERDDLAPGLVLAAHLVRAMGGRLQQAGAALRFTLTAAPADEDQAMPPNPFTARDELPIPFGDGLTVLVLEPHDAMRDYLTEVFDSAGFTLCYDVQELDGIPPALVVCADADADANASTGTGTGTGTAAASAAAALAAAADGARVHRYQTAPRLLHALRPPARAEDFEVVLFKPAPAQQLLAAARCLLGK